MRALIAALIAVGGCECHAYKHRAAPVSAIPHGPAPHLTWAPSPKDTLIVDEPEVSAAHPVVVEHPAPVVVEHPVVVPHVAIPVR